MHIDGSAVIQWIVTAVAGVFSWLMYHYSRSLDSRFNRAFEEITKVGTRMDRLEDRLNTAVPQSIDGLRKELKDLDNRVDAVNTKLVAVESQVKCNYEAFIQRVDRLENNFPTLIESALCQILLKYPGRFNNSPLNVDHDK